MTSTQDPARPGRRRYLWWGIIAVVIVVAVIVVVAVANGARGGDPGTPSPSATRSASPTSTTTPSAAPSASPTAAPDPAVTPTVAPLDGTVPVADSVNVSLASIEAIDATAESPGEVAGPALRVTVLVDNQSGAAVSLSAAIANLYYGSDATPASIIDGSGASPFPASVEAGQQARGTFVFSVPADQRNQVRVEVGYSAAAPVAIFSGQAPA